ncbi:MAG TPA: hypothetical protein VLJ37_08885 [bacterium]|nr:hypothetical protein [bacterium]
MKKFLWLAVAGLFVSGSASGLTVLQLNLEQLTALSEKVFVGRCVSIDADADFKGQRVQKVTFDVIDTLKGEPSKTVTFRQLGTVDGGEDFGMKEGVKIQGLERDLPQYQVGEEAIVFLSAAGDSGITAPVGLAQGKFAVTDKAGLKTVANGAGNRGLFIGADKSPRLKTMSLTAADRKMMSVNGGELPYSDFISLVKKLASQ